MSSFNIPENVHLTQKEQSAFLDMFDNDVERIERNLERYAEWKEGKDIKSDFAVAKTFISNDLTDNSDTSTTTQKKDIQLSYKVYFRKLKGWVRVYKYDFCEIIGFLKDKDMSFLKNKEWKGVDIPLPKPKKKEVKEVNQFEF